MLILKSWTNILRWLMQQNKYVLQQRIAHVKGKQHGLPAINGDT